MDSNHRSNLQQIYSLSPLATRESTHLNYIFNYIQLCIFLCIKPMIGLEPITCWLQISCSANWATSAYLNKNGTNRARTCDPLLVRQVLSQLSYDPRQTTPAGLEPATSAVTGRRSNQLSHWALFKACTLKTEHIFLTSTSFFTLILWISPRPISDCQLNTLLCLHLKPIYLVVFKGSYWLGYLILRGASRLDAFSVYPCRTWLLCHGVGLQQMH